MRTKVILPQSPHKHGHAMSANIEFNRFCVRGVEVAAIDIMRAHDLLGTIATCGQGKYITVTGAHGIVEATNDKSVLEAHRHASIVVPDGMPLVWLGRLLGFSSIGRVYGPELMETVFSNPEYRRLRHFFYGGNQQVLQQLKERLVSRFGDFNLVGIHCPPMRTPGFIEDAEVISRIRNVQPHFIWVGLSTPKQELWLHMHMHKIGFGVGIGVGAAFDLLAGVTRQAPFWIQRSGFEWLFRLAMEPKRLFKRYAIVVPQFSIFFIETLIKAKRNARHPDQVKAS